MISSWYTVLLSKGEGQESAKSKCAESAYAAPPLASAAEEQMPYAFQPLSRTYWVKLHIMNGYWVSQVGQPPMQT